MQCTWTGMHSCVCHTAINTEHWSELQSSSQEESQHFSAWLMCCFLLYTHETRLSIQIQYRNQIVSVLPSSSNNHKRDGRLCILVLGNGAEHVSEGMNAKCCEMGSIFTEQCIYCLHDVFGQGLKCAVHNLSTSRSTRNGYTFSKRPTRLDTVKASSTHEQTYVQGRFCVLTCFE